MATSGSSRSGSSLTLDQLIGLNDEMAALIRAGVPLERGLIAAGRDLQGRLGSIVGNLGERLGRGERLTEVLADTRPGIPEIYRAVVEAGLRSGRLSEALEGMATIARNAAEMRRQVGLALFYPLVILFSAYGLALIFLFQIGPRFIRAFDVLGLAPVLVLNWLVGWGDSVIYWGPIPPLGLLLVVFLWFWSGRSASLDSGFLTPVLRRTPVIGPMLRSFKAANFADLLALLIDHQVPLDEAIELAGQASADRWFIASSVALADSIRSGQDGSTSSKAGLSAFPPLLGWILTGGRGRGELPSSLRHVAWTYRRKAEARGEFLRSALPTFLLVVVGAGAVISYALLLFVPLSRLWDELAVPINH